MLTIAESDARFLVVPEDAAEVDSLPADVTVLRQPVENIYLVSTSVMDLPFTSGRTGQRGLFRHQGRGLVSA